MSNDLTMSPLIIDTVGATSKMTQPIFIEKIRWVGQTSGTAVIADGQGRVIWAAAFVTAELESEIMQWFTGVNVTTMTNGKIYIYYH